MNATGLFRKKLSVVRPNGRNEGTDSGVQGPRGKRNGVRISGRLQALKPIGKPLRRRRTGFTPILGQASKSTGGSG